MLAIIGFGFLGWFLLELLIGVSIIRFATTGKNWKDIFVKRN